MKKAWLILALGLSTPALGQQPPIGIAPVILSEQPYIFDTAEQHGIKVTVLAKGLGGPFAMTFLPTGDLLVAERGIGLRLIRDATGAAVLDLAPIEGMPKPDPAGGNAGLHDIALHPDFATNGLLYFTYNIPSSVEPVEGAAQLGRLAVMSGRYADGKVSNVKTLLEGGDAYPAGSRLRFGKDGTLFISTGAPFGELAQDIGSIYGKILRLNDDGSIPPDNPFVSKEGVHPAVYSFGHRDQHGLTIHPDGAVFSAEHGPNGGDELNLIKPGSNYGWPATTFGRQYDGSPMSGLPVAPDSEAPVLVWLPSIAPSGLLFYGGDKFPAWEGNLLIGSARRGEVPGTGGLERVVFGENFGELRRETLLTGLHQRVRDVVEGPDGFIYVLTDGNEHAVLRIEPATL